MTFGASAALEQGGHGRAGLDQDRDAIQDRDAMMAPVVLRLTIGRAICAVFIWALMTGPSLARGERVFTVADYPVYAQANNAVAAKRTALKDGQQAAFNSVLKRIVPVTAYRRLSTLTPVDAARFMDGMSVKSERNSSTEYIATMDFMFQGEALRKYLRANSVPFVDRQAEETVVVPVTGGDRGPGFSGGRQQWGEIWTGLDLKNSVAPLRIAAVQPGVTPDLIARLNANDAGARRELASQYASRRTVAAVARYDAASARLEVTVAGQDAVGPFTLKRAYPVLDGDVAYAMEYAAAITQGVLEGRWKAASLGAQSRDAGGAAAPLSVEVYFRSPAQWYEIEGHLRALPGLKQFVTQGVSARSADVAFTYPGGGNRLKQVLSEQGYSLTAAGDRWVLQKGY